MTRMLSSTNKHLTICLDYEQPNTATGCDGEDG